MDGAGGGAAGRPGGWYRKLGAGGELCAKNLSIFPSPTFGWKSRHSVDLAHSQNYGAAIVVRVREIQPFASTY